VKMYFLVLSVLAFGAISALGGKGNFYVSEKPEPSNGIFRPGDAISVTFSNPLNCSSSYSAELQILNSNKHYNYLNNYNNNNPLNSLSSVCNDSTISFSLSPAIDYHNLIGKKAKMTLCNVRDQSNNLHVKCVSWKFLIEKVIVTSVTSKVYMTSDLINQNDAKDKIIKEISHLSNCPENDITIENINKGSESSEVTFRFDASSESNPWECLHNLNKYYNDHRSNSQRERRGFLFKPKPSVPVKPMVKPPVVPIAKPPVKPSAPSAKPPSKFPQLPSFVKPILGNILGSATLGIINNIMAQQANQQPPEVPPVAYQQVPVVPPEGSKMIEYNRYGSFFPEKFAYSRYGSFFPEKYAIKNRAYYYENLPVLNTGFI